MENHNTQEYEKNILSVINMNYAVIEFNYLGEIIRANKPFLNTMGYTLDEIVGKHHRIFCDEVYRNTQEYKDFWKSLNEGKSQINEFPRVRKDKKTIWIHASYMPIKDKNNKVTGVIKIAQDITAQKSINADYKGQIEAISKSQGVIEFNLEGKVLTANQNFLDVIGYELREVVGQHYSMFCESAYKLSPDYQKFWEELRRGKYNSGEYKRIGKNDKEIWIQASYNPIIDMDGKPFKVVKFAVDITSRKNVVKEVESTAEQLTYSASALFRTAQDMSISADSTSEESTNSSTAVSQVSSGINSIADKIDDMVTSIKKISILTEKGLSISNDAQLKSKEASILMQELGKQSKGIGKVVNTISSIAMQTNLLSLNASIEAASAGEAGVGFSVVARAVKELATRTSNATNEIADKIDAIQVSIESSIDAISIISSTAEEMTSISGTISSDIEKQRTTSNDVSVIMRESKMGVSDIISRVELVSLNAEKVA